MTSTAGALYQDRIVEALLAPEPAAKGHVLVRPLREAKRLSDLSAEESGHLFLVASYVAAILFQGIHPEGTNIIVEEGEKVTAHVLARKADDGLSFAWQPQKLDEASMKDAQERIADKAFLIGKRGRSAERQEEPKPATPDRKGGGKEGREERPSGEKPPEKKGDDGPKDGGDPLKDAEERENYLIKQLIRIP